MTAYIIRSKNANATWAIIGINLIVGFITLSLQYTSPREFTWIIVEFGSIPLYTVRWIQPYRLLTSMFLHGSFIHLFLNMFALFIFGPDIERVLGKARYLLLYFLSGVMADIIHAYFIAFFFPYKQLLLAPAIGASGAIFGVMAAFAVLFPFRRLVVFMGFPIIAPAIVVIVLMTLIQMVYAFLAPFSQVAYAAHIGGFLTGLILTLIYKPSLRRIPLFY